MSDNALAFDPSPDAPRLLDQARGRLRVKHYSIRTETAYLGWIKRYLLFQGKRHPAQKGRLEAGYDIHTVQKLLGHSDVSTTMIYTHGLNRGGRGVASPLENL